MEKKYLFIPWISLFCLLMGMLFNFCSVFGCQIRIGRHVFPSALIATGVLFCTVQWKRKYAILLSVTGGLFLILFAIWKFEILEQDFRIFVYYINLKSEAYSGNLLIDYPGYEGALYALDSNLLLQMIGILCAAFISLFVFRLHSRIYGFLPVYGVAALGLSVGGAPDSRAVSFLMVGIALALAWLARQEKGGRHFFVQKSVERTRTAIPVYFVLAVIIIVGIFSAKWLGEQQGNKLLSNSEEYLIKQHKMERELKRIVSQGLQFAKRNFGSESDGRLNNEEPKYTNETIMKVTISQSPNESFFLKGFVGGEYQNGSWSPCDTGALHSALDENVPEKGIWNSGYDFLDYFINEWNDCDSVMGGYRYTATRVGIEYVGQGKWGSCAYAPYFSQYESITNEENDLCVDLDGENGLSRLKDAYWLDCYNIGEKDYGTITEQVKRSYTPVWGFDKVQRFQLVNTMNLSSISQERYLSYIKEKYAGLQEGELSLLKRFVEEQQLYISDEAGYLDNVVINPDAASWSAQSLSKAMAVQSLLGQQAEYSTKLPDIPRGEDYVEYFLFHTRKGYCEHFATAGTLMLRAEGIPARYVSGYKVTPDMFQQNEDGTYTAEVRDSDAHAWTEVFVGECAGWFPVEMTPGSGHGSESSGEQIVQTPEVTAVPQPVATEKEETSAETRLIEEGKVTKKPAEPTETPEADGKVTLERGNKKESTNRQNPLAKIFNLSVEEYILLGAAGICLWIVMGRILYLRICAEKYRKELLAYRENRNEFVRIRMAYFLYFLKHCGIHGLDKQNEGEWCRRLDKACAEEYEPEVWECFKQIIQKATFSQEMLSDKEFEDFCRWVDGAEWYIWSGKGKMRRGYLRVIGLARSRKKI